ncbi:MAG: hypothetical protein LBU51_09620 [Bacteroidales bacterium]|nr:hypothetical protein [Bacteroidales bacterium]
MPLNKFKNEIIPNIDPEEHINKLAEMANLNLSHSPEYYLTYIQNIHTDLTDNNGYYSKYINSLANISETEKVIINLYFTKMVSIDNLQERIETSKSAENFIVNEKSLSYNEKQRILITFALYRYSTYFWTTEFPSKQNQGGGCDLIDGAGFYIATHGDFPPRYIEDGASAHAYAAFFSAVIGIITGTLC